MLYLDTMRRAKLVCSPAKSGNGVHPAMEGRSRLVTDLAAQLKLVKKLEQRLAEEQREHAQAKLRIQDLVHERAGLGARFPPGRAVSTAKCFRLLELISDGTSV